MKKLIAALLVLLLSAGLFACSPKAGEPAVPAQKAQALLENGEIPSDAAGLARLRAALDDKLAQTDAAAEKAGLAQDKYYRIIRDELLGAYLEYIDDTGLAGLDGLSGEAYAAAAASVAANMLYMWSQLDDLEARADGYVGICRALCEGDDLFNLQQDARDLTGDGAWPTGYFFDGYLTPLAPVGSFYVCDEYLRGYGMDDALLCAVGADGLTEEETREYIASLKQRGFYTYMELCEEQSLIWYGCWLGDDGSRCFVWVQRVPGGVDDMAQMFADGREFMILTGNFDFELCINAAVLELFL